jgi:hypothetical protein
MSATLPVLLPSLIQRNGIDPRQITVVVGGADKVWDEVCDQVHYRYVTHNSFDHTGLIEVIESDLEGEYWCALHDTCEAGPRFYEAICTFDPDLEHTSIDRDGWMNMGVFSGDFLRGNAAYILSLKNCSKTRAMLSERLYMHMGFSGSIERTPYRIMGEKQPYPGSNLRKVIYFEAADLYKYMANHTQRQKEICAP